MKHRIIIFLLLASARLCAWDGFSSPGYAYGAAAYLDRPLHAYSAALCKAVTAWCDGLAGVQYNPAILDASKSVQLSGSNSFLTDDRKLIAVDGAIPIGPYLVLGPGFRTFGVAGLEQRNEYGVLEGHFENHESAIELAMAGRFVCNISAGFRARYLNQIYKGLTGTDEGNANGMGFDAGAFWQPDNHVCIGVSGLNIGSYVWWGTGHRDIVLPQARLGLAGIFLNRSLIVEADVARTLRQPVDLAMGIQYTLFGILSARAGAATGVDIESGHSRNPTISLGAGARYSFFECNYSITIPTDDSQGMISNQLSVVLLFNEM